MSFNPTIRVYDAGHLYAETARGAGAALDLGATLICHGGSPRFFAYDGETEREITMSCDPADHTAAACRVCRAAR